MFDLIWHDRKGWREAGAGRPIPAPPPDRPVSHASLLLWNEHCVECVAPQCYSSCTLYVPRRDGRCARFAYGIHPNGGVSGLFDYGADITFRRWAKLEARWTGSPALFPADRLRRRARLLRRLSGVTLGFQKLVESVDPRHRVRQRVAKWVRSWQKRRFEAVEDRSLTPDAFYVKVFHPGRTPQRMHCEIVVEGPVFRRTFTLEPGWNEHIIPVSEMPSMPRVRGHIRCWLEGDETTRLVFTWLDFVTFEPVASESAPAPKVKCVAWDLDGTVWDGILAEAGPEGVHVKPGVADLIRQLDERGILQTVASKNDREPVLALLKKFGLDEYLLFPAIHWGSKSESLKQIARKLNIGVDTFAFIDDAPFERAEVARALPQVRLYDPASMGDFLSRPEFDVPVTEESRRRRLMYLDESNRARIAATWGENHDGFLRDCRMVMAVAPPTAEETARCLELLERTNQFNLSGRRTRAEELDTLLASDRHEAFAIRVHDRFGDYGIVGFALFERDPIGPSLVEFVLSCRVASKTVEDTFFLWSASRARGNGAKRMRIRFNETTRNTPLKNALARLPAKIVEEEGSRRVLEMSLEKDVAVPTIVRVEEGRITSAKAGRR